MNFTLVLVVCVFLLVAVFHLESVEAGKKDQSVLVINNGHGKVYYEDEGKKKKKKKKGKLIDQRRGEGDKSM